MTVSKEKRMRTFSVCDAFAVTPAGRAIEREARTGEARRDADDVTGGGGKLIFFLFLFFVYFYPTSISNSLAMQVSARRRAAKRVRHCDNANAAAAPSRARRTRARQSSIDTLR